MIITLKTTIMSTNQKIPIREKDILEDRDLNEILNEEDQNKAVNSDNVTVEEGVKETEAEKQPDADAAKRAGISNQQPGQTPETPAM